MDLIKLNRTQRGKLGENIVTRTLLREGYTIVVRNYRKRYGEIDIVCSRKSSKDNLIEFFFVEVKSKLSREIRVSRHCERSFRLEDNVHERKLRRLRRVVHVFMSERGVTCPIHFMVALVEMSYSGTHHVRLLQNLPL